MTAIEQSFSALPREERERIIRHGVTLRMSDLQKRLFLAESKVRAFSERYHTSLEELEAVGLPDDANVEMHEDYITWHHWAEVAHKAKQDMEALQDIAREGLPGIVAADAGH